MSEEHAHATKKEVKRYWMVFAALTIGTIITVGIANIHFGIILGIIVAVIVALVKGSLVAGYFMHLFHEREFIYFVLAMTGVFALTMIVLILWTDGDQQGDRHGIYRVPARHVTGYHDAHTDTHQTPAGEEH